MRAEYEICQMDLIPVQFAKHLARLPLDFIFLASVRNIWDNVVRNVERGDARVARARKCLHRDRENFLYAERIIKRLERNRETRACAIRVRKDSSTPATLFPLLFDEVNMICIDLRE